MKFALAASLLIASFSTFAFEFKDAQVLDNPPMIECPSNYDTQAVWVWDKELRKFVFKGWECVKVNHSGEHSERE